MDSLSRGLEVLERTRKGGVMTVKVLGLTPGWTKASASRYLAFLSQAGWLERVNETGRPKYVLGRKALEMAPDLRI